MYDAALAERQAERWASANRSGSKICDLLDDEDFDCNLRMSNCHAVE